MFHIPSMDMANVSYRMPGFLEDPRVCCVCMQMCGVCLLPACAVCLCVLACACCTQAGVWACAFAGSEFETQEVPAVMRACLSPAADYCSEAGLWHARSPPCCPPTSPPVQAPAELRLSRAELRVLPQEPEGRAGASTGAAVASYGAGALHVGASQQELEEAVQPSEDVAVLELR